MPGIWVVGELQPSGKLAPISAEVATLARQLAMVASTTATGVVVGATPFEAASELARFVPLVISVAAPAAASGGAVPAATALAELLAAPGSGAPDAILLGTGPDARDLAGALSALTGWGLLANAVGISWEGTARVEQSIFGGRCIATSVFTAGRGIITVRPHVAAPEPHAAGRVESRVSGAGLARPVRTLERVTERDDGRALEDSEIVVAGGRGVGDAHGFELVDDLAAELSAAVGASRAAVDAGWAPYERQIGQTGKVIRPKTYIALGISGAVQHTMGIRGAETIVAVNTDPGAPIGELADLMIVGDVREIVPALLRQLRASRAVTPAGSVASAQKARRTEHSIQRMVPG